MRTYVVAGGITVMLLMAIPSWAQGVSASVVANPFQVKNVAVVLSGTTGFARDVALEQAARQSLPQVLQGALGLPATEATRKARAVGEAMRFVARYQILNEAVLPTYALKADLTFNETMLRKNFGGMVGPAITISASTTSSSTTSSATMLGAMTPQQGQSYIVRVPEPTAAGQDRARRALAALPNTEVTYRLISVQGIELNVRSQQPQGTLQQALAGWQADVRPVSAEAVMVAPTPVLAEPAGASEAAPMAAGVPARPAAAPANAPSRRPAWLPDLW